MYLCHSKHDCFITAHGYSGICLIDKHRYIVYCYSFRGFEFSCFLPQTRYLFRFPMCPQRYRQKPTTGRARRMHTPYQVSISGQVIRLSRFSEKGFYPPSLTPLFGYSYTSCFYKKLKKIIFRVFFPYLTHRILNHIRDSLLGNPKLLCDLLLRPLYEVHFLHNVSLVLCQQCQYFL